MAFPFPNNPVNGQRVTYTNSKGRLMVAIYSSVKNEWEVETVLPPATSVMGAPQITVTHTGTIDRVRVSGGSSESSCYITGVWS